MRRKVVIMVKYPDRIKTEWKYYIVYFILGLMVSMCISFIFMDSFYRAQIEEINKEMIEREDAVNNTPINILVEGNIT